MPEPTSNRVVLSPAGVKYELGHARLGAGDVHDAIAAVCPNLLGISIGNWDDKATWRADFGPEATLEEREAAQAVIDAFTFQDKHPENAGKPNVVR